MFTGLVEAKGRVAWVRRTVDRMSVRIAAPFASELKQGESVAVNGVCQTVVRADASGFEMDTVRQTLSITTLDDLRGGNEVNLERAVKLGDRLGGHMVSGHVDGVGRVLEVRRDANGVVLTVDIPEELSRQVVPRGSIAVDGVSLTVAGIVGPSVTVALIPETLRTTLAGTYRPGTEVNVETDLIAKHLEKLVTARTDEGTTGGSDEPGGLTEERLRELGLTE